MSWKRPLWPATPSHSLHLHTFEYRYDSFFFFFFVSTRMKGEAETRASCRCFRLVSGCSILKKFLKRLLAELRADFFLPTFQSPWFLTPIRIVFGGISRGCVWFYPIGSDSSIIDEFIPSPPLSSEMVYTQPWNRWRVKVNVFRKSGPNGGNFESGGHNGLFRIVWNMCYLHFSWMYFLFIRGMEN